MASTSYLNLTLKSTAFADQPSVSNPNRRHYDWGVSQTGLPVANPKSTPYSIPPNSSQSIFSGTRSTSLDDTTVLTLAVSTLSANRYRFTNTSGTAPVFRTARSVTPNGHTATWTANSNATSTLTSSTTGDFTNVVAGDTLFVPGLTTGDSAGPMSPLNEGFWLVLSKNGTSTTLQLMRPTGTDYSGISEAVSITSNTQLVFFSAAGVQTLDTVDISAGFSLPVRQAYVIQAVTPTWFEVIATGTLPVSEVATPTTSGIAFYSSAKRFVMVEVDQEAAIQYNGDSSTTNRVSPIVPGDPDGKGFSYKWGATWSLTVVNRSSNVLELNVLTAE